MRRSSIAWGLGWIVCLAALLSQAAPAARGEGANKADGESRVTAALDWLKRHQSPDGGWDVDGFTERCDPAKNGPCDGAGSLVAGDPAATGLAVLAFLGAGYTPGAGTEYADTVRNGLDYLKKIQNEKGYFVADEQSPEFLRCHAIATLAMAEAFGVSGDEACKESAARAVAAIVSAQNDHPEKKGERFGWRHFPKDGDNDTIVTGWMTLALKSAKSAGLDVPDAAFKGVQHWLDHVTDDVYHRAGYQSKGGGSPIPMSKINRCRETEICTAIAITCRVFIGEKPAAARIKGGAALLNQDRPEWNEAAGSVDYQYWYFGALASFQVGGDHWKFWSAATQKILPEHQRAGDDCNRGSWDPQPDKWGESEGRVIATALNCLTLEIQYRYDRVFK